MNIHIVDLIFLIPFVIYMIIGYRKGAIIEIISLLALVVAILFCLRMTNFLLQSIGLDNIAWWVPYVAYIAVFIGVYLLVQYLGKLLEKIIKVAQLNWINNIGGAIIGGLKVIFLFLFILWVTERAQLTTENYKTTSMTYKYLHPVSNNFMSFIKGKIPFITNVVDEAEKYIKLMIYENRRATNVADD